MRYNQHVEIKSMQNMKNIKLLLLSALLIPALAFAQNSTESPRAGLTPESSFYFLDTLGEALQEFFTFNPESKARLQITFAAERVAEIKVLLEARGVDAKGLEVAQSRLQAHLAAAVAIVTEQKTEGKDITALAKELDDDMEQPKSALIQAFKQEERDLETKEKELKAQLKAAHQAGDTAKEEDLAQELGKVKAQLELLELKEGDIEEALEAEEDRIEEEMEGKIKAEKAIAEAKKELAEIQNEAAEGGVELPASAFAKFNNLLSQAKAALTGGNYTEARRLAKQAEESLEKIEETIEELEDIQELKEEAEEGIEEAEQEEQEEQAKDEAEQQKNQEEDND